MTTTQPAHPHPPRELDAHMLRALIAPYARPVMVRVPVQRKVS